jgi:type II secretory ATPase GspE/PulE/Tfp pilus assembly ATPase PilB-like protein
MVEGVNVSRAVTVALKVLSKMDIAESRRPQDNRLDQDELKSALTQYRQDLEARKSKEKHKEEVAKLSKALEDLKVAEALLQKLKLDMRVSTLPCINGEKTVLRLLPQENPFSTIDTLGFSPKTLPLFQGWLQQPQGMIILTGPTGSGKTSTLYTSLQAIATESVNVVTVEDPVEYVLPRITQTQVHEAAGMTFAAGLRSILRQDPDIIMVGEIRDHETAETAVRASLTGHLVLTTLHTNDAISAIPRLKDIGPDPGLLSDALLGIVAQRLVRRVCPHCAQPHHPTESELKVLDLDLRQAHPEAWRKGQGCARCLNSGYLGREAVMELLVMDDRVKQLIYEGSMSQVQSYLREESNFYPFRLAAIEKVTTGLTTVPELLRVLPQSAFSRRSDNGTYPTIARPIPAPLSHPSPQEGRGALSIT